MVSSGSRVLDPLAIIFQSDRLTTFIGTKFVTLCGFPLLAKALDVNWDESVFAYLVANWNDFLWSL